MTGGAKPLLQDAMAPPNASCCAAAVQSSRKPGRFLPQTIAHRGYKASFPENSMGAFRGAAEVGAHAIETDLHLSADGVVDPSLKRCFGIDRKIRDCTWEYLSGLETVREPRQGMPRLSDLLEWLAEAGNEHIWILLDVKVDDGPDALLGAVARTVKDAPPSKTPWDQRIILGLWNATFIAAARRLLPSHPMVLICFHLPYAGHFFEVANLGFNILRESLVGPCGSRFLRRARDADRPVMAWTVNDERWMEWCIRKNAAAKRGPEATTTIATTTKLIDGVITDDPRLFLEVCKRWEDEQDGVAVSRPARREGVGGRVRSLVRLLAFPVVVRFLFLLGRWRGKFDYFTNVKRLER
ncbi:hypothetical protein ACO1O0_002228 [Amphichorda felina]